MRIIVCGSRTFTDHNIVTAVLDGLWRQVERQEEYWLAVHEGGANGADTLARNWALNQNVDHVFHVEHPADWTKDGKAAGPIRNQKMLNEAVPDFVIAFVDKPLDQSRGTADMVRRARKAGVPTYVIEAST